MASFAPRTRWGQRLTDVNVPDLQHLHYIGFLKLSGQQRSRNGSDWMLYGKVHRKQNDFIIDTQQSLIGSASNGFAEGEWHCFLNQDSGAHNLYIINDDRTHDALSLKYARDNVVTAFAVGGQYHAPESYRKRGGGRRHFLVHLCARKQRVGSAAFAKTS